MTTAVFTEESRLGANALYEQGRGYYADGLYRLAADSFQRCLALDPAHEDARNFLGMIGQGYIDSEVEAALERFEPLEPSAETELPRAPQASSRNLDFYTSPDTGVLPPVVPVSPQSNNPVADTLESVFNDLYIK